VISLQPAAPSPTPDVADLLRPGTLRLPTLPPLALYVHFPWCVRKCPYCDFNSHEAAGGLAAIPEARYLDALRADLDAALPLVWGRRIVSIFFGGGTPSLISTAALERLLSDLRARLPLEPSCEITLEANPGTFEAAKFSAFRNAGINRLSIGVQSFDDRQLRRLGRIHDRGQALAAVEAAQRDYDNLNLDLMYALPEQSPEAMRADIEQALRLAPPHLSLYQLTLEPNTVFAKYPPLLPDEDTAAAMHEWIEERMAASGYEHYEVSAYARGGRLCTHNLNYWQFGDYLGIGAGAHSKISFPGRILRQARLRQPAGYIDGSLRGTPLAESAQVSRGDLAFEFMLNALRLNAGVPTRLFAERTGLPISAIEPTLRDAQRRGLLTADLERITPTALGRRFLSDLQSLFLSTHRSEARRPRKNA
jgi:putative oxygen-independent coproporphyrinogen III oxidase